jgi:dihydrolipoamide dehydrogenase
MRLGAEVTVIEFADRLCPSMDKQTMTSLQKILSKQGMKFMFSTKVTASEVKDSKGQKTVTLKYENMKDNSAGEISGDVVLVSTGRKPFTDGLGLESIDVQKDQRGFIQVDKHWVTNVAGVYAIGDVIPGPMLAHKAEEEGVAVAEIVAGQAGHVNYQTVPGVIYTFPEVASVGLTEEQLQEKGIPYRAGSFPFIANGRAKALGTTDGQVKILAHAESDKILGGHIIGPRASELLGEIVVAMEFGGSSEDLARSFHAHPTLNEVVREAALAVDKRARQM